MSFATAWIYVNLLKKRNHQEFTGIAMLLALICDTIWLTTLAANLGALCHG